MLRVAFKWDKIDVTEWSDSGNWSESGTGTVEFVPHDSVAEEPSILFDCDIDGETKVVTYDLNPLEANKKYLIYFRLEKDGAVLENFHKFTIRFKTGDDHVYTESGYYVLIFETNSTPQFRFECTNQQYFFGTHSIFRISEMMIREISSEWLIRNGFFDTYFGAYERSIDSNKDNDGLGTLERYNLMIADDIDQQIVPYMTELINHIRCVDEMMVGLIPIWEEVWGYELYYEDTLRRKLLQQILSINKIKGTPKSYKVLFSYIDTSVTITEDFNGYGFDSDEEFDSDARTFDSGECQMYCSGYSLALVTTRTLDSTYYLQALNIIRYLQPLNAELTGITFNGNSITSIYISVTINSDGDLIFFNEFDPDLTLHIDSNGDLIVGGANSSKYTVVNGDLIYTL